MKLVHKLLTALITTACAGIGMLTATAQELEYLQHYNPANGFKPAQANLTKVALQLAGSLEHHGSPEPYFRHMQAEHARISRLYEQSTGKPHQSRLPAHMTEGYIDRLAGNWNTLAPLLGLESFAKEIGRCMREGIMGTRLSGTIAVQIFNEHQQQVAGAMADRSLPPVGFEELRARIWRELELDRETIDTTGYEISRRDAVGYASVLDGKLRKLYGVIESKIKPEKAPMIKEGVAGILEDLGYLAQSELEIAMMEQALNQAGS